MDKQFLIDSIKNVLEKDSDILFTYLYGSCAYEEAPMGGDIDIAIYLKPMEMEGYLWEEEKITSDLITTLRYDRIDLRILNVCPFWMQYEVIKEGILLFVKDQIARINFEEKVMNEYFKFKPLLEEYRQLLSLRIKSGS